MIRSALVALSALALTLAACVGQRGADGMTGPEGPPGPKGDTGPGFMTPPSVSAVTPSKLAVTLSTDVTVSGFATNWGAGVQVSFGQGITVNSVKVGSKTGLVANVTVAADAMPGARDVTVTQGTEVSTFTGVFTVVPLFEVTPVGAASRGGYWYFEVRANDPEFGFPSQSDDVTLSVSPSPAMGEMTAELSVLKPRALVVRVHSDFQAPLVEYSVTLAFDGQQLRLPAFELADKQELMLSDTTPLVGMTMRPFESKLIKYTPAATPEPVVLHVSGGLASRWQLILLDANGKPRDTNGSLGAPAPGNDLVITGDLNGTYLMLSEVEGKPSSQFTLTAVTGFNPVTEQEPNDAREMAQALALVLLAGAVGIRIAGNVAVADESDFYSFMAQAGDVGKRIHVRSYTTDYIWFDTEILAADGSTLASDSVNSITTDFYSPPLPAAGEYFIHFIGDYDGNHDIVISLQ